MKTAISLFVVLACLTPSLRADELRLKDGTKVTGKIVGFEDNSFKVETSYGYALVRKDQVVDIIVADEAKKSVAGKKAPAAHPARAATAESAVTESQTGAEPDATEGVKPSTPGKGTGSAAATNEAARGNETAPAAEAAASTGGAPAASHDAAPPAAAPGATRASSKVAAAPAAKPVPVASAAAPAAARPGPSGAAAPQPAAAAPANAPPEPMREQVVGNSYSNDTFGFRMYKPPDWEIIADAPKTLPGSIVAMGTSDQTTYLLIGQEALVGSLETQWAPTERRLKGILANYRPLGAKRIVVSGVPAIQSRFRGTVDEHDWSGSVTLIARDNQLFTIFGMTSADSDLVQIQENVIARTVASLEFRKMPVANKSR